MSIETEHNGVMYRYRQGEDPLEVGVEIYSI